MRRTALVILAMLSTLSLLLPSGQAAQKLRVVTTIPDLKSLAEAVGGDLVEVDSLTRGTQNFHEAEVRPSMMLKLRRADALIENGAELDAWADVAVTGSNNGNIIRGAPGSDRHLARASRSSRSPRPGSTARWATCIPWAIRTSPSIPGSRLRSRRTSSTGSRASPPTTGPRSRRTARPSWKSSTVRWTAGCKLLEPVRGAKVVVYHPDFIYFLTRFGLVQVGMLEDRPGIPPSPQHLVQIIRQMKAEQVKVILVEPWNDLKLAERVAAEAGGAKAIVMASSVGAVKGADNYIAAIDYNITTLAKMLK